MKEIKRRYEISDEEYSRIEHLLPKDEPTGKKRETTEAKENEAEWDAVASEKRRAVEKYAGEIRVMEYGV